MKYSLRSLMTFSIRDMFWLLSVLALGLGWWVNSRQLWLSRREIDEERIEVIKQAKELRDNLAAAKEDIEGLTGLWRGERIHYAHDKNTPDWSVLEEQIPPRKGYRAATGTPPNSSAPAPTPP
jgi:hypothetical protein